MEPQTPQSTLTSNQQKREELPPSLLHFPDELLLHVIEELGEQELDALCLVNKRFQRLTLPLYLSRHGIDIPLNFPIDTIDHLTFSAQQLMARPCPGLRLVSFAKRIRNISCEIGPFPSRYCTTTAVNNLHQMISNTHNLENVELRFDHWFFEVRFLHTPWKENCTDLLDVAAKRCTSLTLSDNGVHQETVKAHLEKLIENEAAKWRNRSPDQLMSRGSGTSMLHRFLRLMRSWLPRAPTTYSHSEQKPPEYSLKTFVLCTPVFLLPPYTAWALRLLNTAPLIKLDLLGIQLSSRVSSAFFGALAIPTLQHLRIYSCQFELHALAKFLSRHNTISALDVVHLGMLQLPSTTLPELVSLKSIPNNLNHLLASTDAFPKLSQVRVIIYLSIDDEFHFSRVERSLAEIAERLVQTNIRIGLDVHSSSRTDNWINLEDGPDDLSDYPVLSRVREIAFCMPRPDIVANTAIPKWLSLFPLLDHVEFLDGPNDLSRKAKMTLLRCIVQDCVGIRSVKIDEETRDVAAWLAEGG